jgi:hypothetical protein
MNPFATSFTLNIADDGTFLVFLVVAVFLLWLATLVSFLKRTDMKDVDRIVWAIVLCVLNVLGMLLYWFLAPVAPGSRTGARSDKELKEYFNSRGE